MAEYFYSKNQKQKAKEFYYQIITLENSNENIKLEAQKKLRSDFNELNYYFFFNIFLFYLLFTG